MQCLVTIISDDKEEVEQEEEEEEEEELVRGEPGRTHIQPVSNARPECRSPKLVCNRKLYH